MNEPMDMAPTRQSLLGRLKDWNDQESWKVFFDTYWGLIYHTARKAGLTEEEAQDVVQETVLYVSKQMATFEYDPARSSFKSWLLRLTRWRITDQLRKRQPGIQGRKDKALTSTRTATVERVPDPAGPALEALWEEEWEKNLMQVALERVKRKVDAKQYQVFDFYVLKNWPVLKVTRALRVSAATVYLAKHRISRLIKQEITHLQTKPF